MVKRRVVVSSEAVKRAGERSTRASAKVEGREVPADYVRPAAVQRFLDDHAVKSDRWRKDDSSDGIDTCDNGLLDVLRREVWPLLSDGKVLNKADRERILGYDPETGVFGHGGP
ncbi:hypothetical protein [Mycolicibacterium sp. F2034L]|uniref:hypothetical protein n=1 Tax=Mycolicibacterium sp. F2034L TaxID=2926422 RepID=UPI001FF6D659|nr:hypothetical protein [Mycolicibacterium sp. F2034L]MCK0177102.1 hypothetical protein [Mycolicibacterium sp. F2034L]